MSLISKGLVLEKTEDGYIVSGKTFPHKEALKSFGGKWNPERKVWFFKGENEQVELFVHNLNNYKQIVKEEKKRSFPFTDIPEVDNQNENENENENENDIQNEKDLIFAYRWTVFVSILVGLGLGLVVWH